MTLTSVLPILYKLFPFIDLTNASNVDDIFIIARKQNLFENFKKAITACE